MAVQQSIWKIEDKKAKRFNESSLANEKLLEDLITDDISILSEDWLLIGRQVLTDHNKYIDLLAIDRNGNLIIIELKRDKTEREVVSQALDYASWVRTLDSERVIGIYNEFVKNQSSLDEAWKKKFNSTLDDDDINGAHKMVIVASQLDAATERIVEYLSSEFEVPINVIFFSVFNDDKVQFLSRAWLIEPQETEENASTKGPKVPWNGEYYVSFGGNENRSWEDAKKYGFISAGGGKWYSQTLYQLELKGRIWVNIPQIGYVACGEVISEAPEHASECLFDIDGTQKPLTEIKTKGNYSGNAGSSDEGEYIVKVRWIKVFDVDHACKEVGFFGNQNSVCKPKTPKWNYTVDRLKAVWGIKS